MGETAEEIGMKARREMQS